MNEKLVASARTVENQANASNPASSAWVSANAGSGKTTVLAQRVVKLLLAGVEPAKILCLTFTKAAAANMANRVFKDLGVFATLDDEALDHALRRFGVDAPTASRRAQARRLFAEALDTPGGLKVLTIHAFCERILHQFTLEAQVPADFSVLDDQKRAEIIAKAKQDVFAHLDTEPEQANALKTLLGYVSATAVDEALENLLGQPELLGLYPDPAALAVLYDRLRRFLRIPEKTPPDIYGALLGESLLRPHARELIDVMSASTLKGDQENAQKLIDAFDPQGIKDPTALYVSIFQTKAGDFTAKPPLSAAPRKKHPHLGDIIDSEVERLKTVLDLQKAVITRTTTHALLTLAQPIAARYQQHKRLHGALDFSDLIIKTRALLESGQSAWVLYKLDGGIDHVLVDEAQDTSPDQWAIIRALTEEFTAGETARSRTARTMFAVGDEKQSIYSFQGASPAEFGGMRSRYRNLHDHAAMPFTSIELTQSFRSAGAILDAVDKVFEAPAAYAGLESDSKPTVHDTARQTAYGRVELWPLVATPRNKSDDTAWDAPLDTLSQRSGTAILADRIAGGLRAWIKGEHPLARGEKIHAGDILILLRSRSPLFNAIIRALKAHGLPVAGADRLHLSSHILTLDLLALGDALLQEHDDLQLATILKSPLFNFDDTDLLALAPQRQGSLRQALRNSGNTRYSAAAQQLDLWQQEALTLSPYRFYTHILGRDKGRSTIMARFGVEAEDILNEFQRLAMDFSTTNTPTLAGFLHWMRAMDVEVKRDQEMGGHDIRVMTAHGAKGLEARIVVLADLGKPPSASKVSSFFKAREEGVSHNAPDLFLWSQGQKYDCAAVQTLRSQELELAEAEHRRLLYVALTRAQDRLVIAGHTTLNKEGPSLPPQSWYGMVHDGLKDHARSVECAALGGDVLIYENAHAPQSLIPESAEMLALDEPPAWLFQNVSGMQYFTAANLTPSQKADRTVVDPAVLARGTAIHNLLHRLANAPAEQREKRIAGADPEHVNEALAVLDNPALAALFGAGSRGEVDVSGFAVIAQKKYTVRGRIDRLVVEKERIVLVDFKTDIHVPDQVPPSYSRQLALYRAALMPIFPQHRIEATIIWTRTLRRDTLTPEMLDSALIVEA